MTYDPNLIARKTDPLVGAVEIVRDDFMENPITEWDHIAETAIYRNKALSSEGTDPEDLTSEEIKHMSYTYADNGGYFSPVFKYSHGMDSYSLGREYPFNDPFDSGVGGFIWVTPEKAAKIWPEFNIQQRNVASYQAAKALIALMNAYVQGDCYVLVQYDPEFHVLESIGGFWECDGWDNLKDDFLNYALNPQFAELIKKLEPGDIDPVEVTVIKQIPKKD